jgi:hypothetical protein
MILKGTVTQTGADTFTAYQILTGLTVDGKAGWQINAFKATWINGYTAAAADNIANCVLSTLATSTTPNLDDEIARVSWSVQNTAGVAVAMVFEPIKMANMLEPRVTAQTDLYVHSNTTATGLTNIMYWELDYDIVKLSDIEVLRLMVAGA